MRAHKWRCFLLAAFCWCMTALAATRMHTDTSSLAFFPDDAPEIRQMAEALDISPASRLLLVDLSTSRTEGKYALAQTADALVQALAPDMAERAGMFAMPDPDRLLTLLPFMTDAAALEVFLDAARDEHVEAAIRAARDSLGSLAGSAVLPWLRTDPLAFRRILLSRLPAFETELLPDPLLGYPLSRDGRHLLLMLRPKHSIHDVRAATLLMDTVQEALQTYTQPGMQSLVVGGHRHSAANTRAVEQDVTNIVFFSMAGFFLIYLLLVRSRGALWLLLVPLFATSVALGGMALLLPVLSGLALGFGASVLGLAEDYAVHVHFALRSGREPAEVLNTMALPLFQGYLINGAGFAVLLLSGIPAVRQLAGFALLAISAGFVLAVTIAPLCPWFAEPLTLSSRHLVQPRRPALLRVAASAAILISLCCALFAAVQIDVSPRTMGADMAQLQEDATRLRSIWGAQDKEMVVVQAQDRESAMDLSRAIVAALRQQSPENAVSALSDIWPSPEQRRENMERWHFFVRTQGKDLQRRIREAARTYGFTEDAFAPFERILALPETAFTPELLRNAGLGEVLDTFVYEAAQDPDKVKVLLFTQNKAELSGLPPELRRHALALSPGVLETALLEQLDHEKRLLPLAWLVCFSLLFLYFRDIRRTLLASLPPLCSISCILAWMAFTGTPLTLAGMAALPLVLGLAADHGIMVTHELTHGMKLGVERAVLVASLTSLAGMGLLALAHHPALKAMGEVIFLGLLVELPASLWLLPGLCRAPDQDSGDRA
jgi:predicted exporter